ncbi:MAG: hypothetical protein JW810_12240 [Sedimentisphaerales bacterium]|nr:hypothetical protein [Sedimentisphaerales bacterium]
MNKWVVLLGGLVWLSGQAACCRADPNAVNLAPRARVRASSVLRDNLPARAVDGRIGNASRWVSDRQPRPHWLALEWDQAQTIGCLQLLFGWQARGVWADAVSDFVCQYRRGDDWIDIAGTAVRGNTRTARQFVLAEPIVTDAIRFLSEDPSFVRLVELKAFGASPGGYPDPPAEFFYTLEVDYRRHYVMVNQSGYALDGPKRFTSPLVRQRAAFVIADAATGRHVYAGTVERGLGDFSAFRPERFDREYVITVSGEGRHPGRSVPFAVGPYWRERVCLEPALRFMVDCRSVVGTHRSAYGGCPWRDGTYYSFEVPSLVMLYLAHPAFFEQMDVQIDYLKDRRRVLADDFALVQAANDQDALRTARDYYRRLDPPVGRRVPDIVQLIHWGIGWTLLDPESEDPSRDPAGNKIHGQTVEQFAFFLYGYPAYRRYFSERFYQQAREFARTHWREAGLFEVITTIGGFKGRHCPGHSILPNLLMYEVARRENLPDAERFFQAAYRQTEWVIRDLDLADPRTTKGQRMSEHKLITGLAAFRMGYPDRAPPGLTEKIQQWARIMIERADNRWDFRTYDVQHWTLPRHDPASPGGGGWNEPGNVAGFPAPCWAAAGVLDDAGSVRRLEQMAAAHFDNLFGRNPVNAHSSCRGPRDFAGVERGWPLQYPEDLCARLERVRGSLNSTAAGEQYPFNPAGEFRHAEGWTAFNAAFNVGLAYACRAGIRLEVVDAVSGSTVDTIRYDRPLRVRLSAADSMSGGFRKAVPVQVQVASGSDPPVNLNLFPVPGQPCVSAGLVYLTRSDTAEPNWIGVPPGASLTISYGYGLWGQAVTLRPDGRRALGTKDYLVFAIYLAGIFAVGLYFTRSNRSAADMFAAGRRSPWWLSGLSGFMTMFSAGTFVVWGGIAYEQGLVAISINLCYGVAALLVGYFLAARWRRMGIATPAEYIELRFGRAAIRFYAAVMMIYRLLGVAVALYSLAVLLTALMPLSAGNPLADPATGNVSIRWAILLFGAIVVIYTMAGGLWAVLMTDTLQFIVLNLAVLFVVPLCFLRIGDVGAWIQSVPPGFFHPANNDITWFFLLGWCLIHFFMLGAEWAFVQRYLCVPGAADARKSCYLFGALYLVSPFLWLLPPLLYRGMHPGANPEEAYILACGQVLPAGMLGLMLAAMFSATASMVSSQLNVFAGVLTSDFYRRLFRPDASETQLVAAGRIFTLLLGAVLIGLALAVPALGGAKEVILSVTALMVTPLLLPPVWGLFSRRITQGCIWPTALISFALGLAAKFGFGERGFFRDVVFLAPLGDWISSHARSVDTAIGVMLPIVILALIQTRLRGESKGFRRVAALAQRRMDVPPRPSNRLPAVIVALSVGACGVLMLILALLGRESRLITGVFALALLGIAAGIALFLRRASVRKCAGSVEPK